MERAFYQFGLPVAPVCGAVHAELYLLLQRLAVWNSDVWMACLPCYALLAMLALTRPTTAAWDGEPVDHVMANWLPCVKESSML